MQGREHVEDAAVAVRVLTGGKPPRLLLALAAGEIGDELEQHVGRRRQRYAIGQHLAQHAAGDGKFRRRIERSEHRGDQIGIVGGKYAEAIADDVVEIASREIDIDVPGFLLLADHDYVVGDCAQTYTRQRFLYGRWNRSDGRVEGTVEG